MSSFALSATEFDVVWRAQGNRRPPVVLDMPSPGATYAERARIEQGVWAALTARGLASGSGEPGRGLERALELIARPLVSLELYTDAFNLLLVRGGRSAVLVEFAGDELVFHTVPQTGLAQTLLSWPPELPPGVGQSITVELALLAKAEALGSPVERRAVLQDGGMARGSARTLVDMISGAAGHGQIVAEVVERGVVRRSERVVSFFHNGSGRYRVIRDGDHVTITPTTTAQLAVAADELVSALT